MPDISEPIRRVDHVRFETNKRIKPKNPKEETNKDKFKDFLKNFEDESEGEGHEKNLKQNPEKTAEKSSSLSPLDALNSNSLNLNINWVESEPENDDKNITGKVIDEKA